MHILEVRRWLPGYQSAWVRQDLVAGLTLAAYLLPAGIGDASLAGLAQAGLYACLYSGLVFWLFCGSRHTVITVTSALSRLARSRRQCHRLLLGNGASPARSFQSCADSRGRTAISGNVRRTS